MLILKERVKGGKKMSISISNLLGFSDEEVLSSMNSGASRDTNLEENNLFSN